MLVCLVKWGLPSRGWLRWAPNPPTSTFSDWNYRQFLPAALNYRIHHIYVFACCVSVCLSTCHNVHVQVRSWLFTVWGQGIEFKLSDSLAGAYKWWGILPTLTFILYFFKHNFFGIFTSCAPIPLIPQSSHICSSPLQCPAPPRKRKVKKKN